MAHTGLLRINRRWVCLIINRFVIIISVCVGPHGRVLDAHVMTILFFSRLANEIYSTLIGGECWNLHCWIISIFLFVMSIWYQWILMPLFWIFRNEMEIVNSLTCNWFRVFSLMRELRLKGQAMPNKQLSATVRKEIVKSQKADQNLMVLIFPSGSTTSYWSILIIKLYLILCSLQIIPRPRMDCSTNQEEMTGKNFESCINKQKKLYLRLRATLTIDNSIFNY